MSDESRVVHRRFAATNGKFSFLHSWAMGLEIFKTKFYKIKIPQTLTHVYRL